MKVDQKCPPLSLTTEWAFWTWIYNMQDRNTKQGKKKYGR